MSKGKIFQLKVTNIFFFVERLWRFHHHSKLSLLRTCRGVKEHCLCGAMLPLKIKTTFSSQLQSVLMMEITTLQKILIEGSSCMLMSEFSLCQTALIYPCGASSPPEAEPKKRENILQANEVRGGKPGDKKQGIIKQV